MKQKANLQNIISNTVRKLLNEDIDTQIAKWIAGTEVVDNNNKPILVHHFTNSEFNEFDLNKARTSGYSQLGFWFGSDEKKSSNYGRIKKSCFLKIANGYYLDGWDEFITHVETYSKTFGKEASEFREYLKAKGYDGVVIENVDIDGVGEQTIYIVFDNNQIKCIN